MEGAVVGGTEVFLPGRVSSRTALRRQRVIISSSTLRLDRADGSRSCVHNVSYRRSDQVLLPASDTLQRTCSACPRNALSIRDGVQ